MDRSEPKFICDASGFEFPISEGVKQWDGAFVHRKFADKRNPQDFVKAGRDSYVLPITRPESPDVFLETNEVQASDL